MSSSRPRILPSPPLRLLLCLLALFALWGQPLALAAPTYTVESVPNTQLKDKFSFVSNPDGILPADQVAAINALALELRERKGIELAVVALGSIGDNDARAFANELFARWGLGKKGQDNGLLILLVTEPPQRSVVFEVGYGLEGYLPDVVCYRLQQQYMIPDLKANNYGQAMLKGVQAVRDYLDSGEYRGSPDPVGDKARKGGAAAEDDNFAATLLLVLLVLGVLALARKHPGLLGAILRAFFMGGGGPRGGGGFGGGGFSGGSRGGGGGGSWGGGRSGGGGSISRF